MFFTRDISWDCYFDTAAAPRQMSPSQATLEETYAFVQSLDWRLLNVWQDLRHYSYLSTLACSTGYKLDHKLYSDIMTSVLYRLLHMTLGSGGVTGSAFRLALIALTADMFLRWHGLRGDYNGSFERFSDALGALGASPDAKTVPQAVLAWMLLLRHVLEPPGTPTQDVHWLSEVIGCLELSSWEEARQTFKTMVWIDFLHDAKGEAAFCEALHNNDRQAISGEKGDPSSSPRTIIYRDHEPKKELTIPHRNR